MVVASFHTPDNGNGWHKSLKFISMSHIRIGGAMIKKKGRESLVNRIEECVHINKHCIIKKKCGKTRMSFNILQQSFYFLFLACNVRFKKIYIKKISEIIE